MQNPGGEGNRKDDGVKPDHLIGEHDGSVGAHVGGKADHHVTMNMYLARTEGAGLTVVQAQYMIDHWNDEVPEEDIVEDEH